MSRVFTLKENQAWARKQPKKMSSACMAIISSNQVLMVKAFYKDHWTFPSGIVDENESPKHAAIRETLEEVGLDIENDKCELLSIIYTATSGGDQDRFNFAFTTSLKNQNVKLSVPNDEIEETKWVDFKDIAKLAGNRGSYIKLQDRLTGSTDDKYLEVYPLS